MRSLRIFAVALALSAAALACSKDPPATATSDLDAALKPQKFEPDPLGELPPVDSSESLGDMPTTTATVASPAPSASAIPSASGKGKTLASTTAPSPATPTVTSTVKLLDPGQPPRQKLRYKFKVDQNENVTMDMAMGASVDLGAGQRQEQKLPLIRVVLGVEPKSISPEGDLKYAYHLLSTEVVADPQTPPQLAAAMKGGIEGMRGLSGTAVISPRGITKDSTFDSPPNASSQTAQMMEQIKQTARELAAPFPEEEVGKGAKWEKSSKVELQGQKATQRETYTLVDLAGDTGKVDVVITQSSPGGALSAPGIPAGSGVKIESMNANGKGTTSFDLTRLAPTSQLDAATTMSLVGQKDGETQRLKMVMKVALKLSGAKQ